MAGAYQKHDRGVVDYELYTLDPELIDPATGAPLELRGPRPKSLENGAYFVCVGGAQTFGRFCARPYPILLQEKLGLPALNLGRGGAGPSFFSPSNGVLLGYLNRARFAVIQVMSGRSASNSLYRSLGLGSYVRRSDGASVGADQAFQELLERATREDLRRIVSETRADWLERFNELLAAIRVPRILLWFSVREPAYRERYSTLASLYGDYPQLVNAEMVRELGSECEYSVKCVSRRGLPQPLRHRKTGDPIIVRDEWGGVWSSNTYYPSPEMHADAAEALEPSARRCLDPRREGQLARKGWNGATRARKARFLLGRRISRAARTLAGRAVNGRPRRFIILGEGRSGSNFLRGLLNSHPGIVTFGELFRFPDSIGWEIPDYDRFLQSKSLLAWSQRDPASFLEREVFGSCPRGLSAVGFKIFYYHAREGDRAKVWDYLQDRRDIAVLHIKRWNALRTFLSLRKAFLTNRWTVESGPEEDRLTVPINYEACLRHFEWSSELKEEFDRRFRDHPVLQIEYETLCRDLESECARIQDFLGVPRRRLTPLTFKQAALPLSRAIENYAELKERFEGTAWSAFFEE